MGQARRRRQRERAEQLANTLPFLANKQAIRELGDDGLAELVVHLWPKDCQTCGWELGTDPPSLLVRDFMIFLSASLHHRRCQPPSWEEVIILNSAPVLSYDVLAFEFPFQKGKENPKVDLRPIFLVNPHLEQVSLSRTPSGWRVNTIEHWMRVGLHTPGPGFIVDRPIPDITADLNGNELSVAVADTGDRWSLTVSDHFCNVIQDPGGITLAVSTAVIPTRMPPDQFAPLMRSGQVAMGWISLAGSAQPLTPMPAPENVRTFVLHWGPRRTDVGELLASTSQALSNTDVQQWARDHLAPEHQTLAPWEPDDDEPGAWTSFHPLHAIHHYLRREGTGWALVKGISRAPADMIDHKKWATHRVKINGNRIIDWIPRPTTTPGYTTFHGAGIPR